MSGAKCFEPPSDAGQIRADRANLSSRLAGHVLEHLSRPPLDALAHALLSYPDDSTSRRLFGAYDRFLGILSNPEKRKELSDLPIERALESRIWLEARDASHDFRDALEAVFLKGEGLLSRLTLRFGVF